MWCHVCKINFTDQENFMVHIMKEHKPDSEFYTSDSDGYLEQNEDDDIKIETFDESEIDVKDEDMMEHFDESENSADYPSEIDESENSADYPPEIDASAGNTRSKKKYTIHSPKANSEDATDLKLSVNETNQKTNNSEYLAINNQLYIINSVVSQEKNDSFVVGNQSAPYMFVINPLHANAQQTSDTQEAFDFNSRNILKWLSRLKEMCRTLKFPLPSSLFNTIKSTHKQIFDHYSNASSSEETGAVLKVYEELDNMIHRHITSINEQL